MNADACPLRPLPTHSNRAFRSMTSFALRSRVLRVMAALALTGLTCATARAESADEILSKNRKALGGEAALAKATATVYQGQEAHQGFTHPFTWSALSPLFLKEETGADGYHTAAATDGVHDWVQLFNGVTSGLAGSERDPLRLMSVVLNHAYLAADDNDLKVGEALAEDDGKVWTVRMTGRGASFELGFDAKSWLLTRASVKDAQGRLTVSLEEYKKSGDLMFPNKVTATTDKDGITDQTVYTIQKLDRKAELEEGLFERPSEAPKGFKLADGKSASVPMKYKAPTQHIIVQVSVNGSDPAPFMLDSAAPATVVDSALAKKLTLSTVEKLIDRDSTGTRAYELHPVKKLSVGGLELNDTVVASADLGAVAKEVQMPLAGILGQDVFERLVVEVKYAAGTVTFFDPAGYADSGSGEALPLDAFGRINVLVNGQALLSLIPDTGSDAAVNLAPTLVKREKLAPPPEKRLPVAIAGLDGKTQAWQGVLEAVQLGQLSVPKVVTVFQELPANAPAVNEADEISVLGNQVLERFNVTFDWPRRQLLVEQGPWFASAFPYDRSGLKFKAGSDWVVESVAASMAEQNIKPGDQLLGVETESGFSKDKAVIEAKFRQAAGTKVKLKIKRGKAELPVELTLKEQL